MGSNIEAYLKLPNVTTDTYLFRVYADTRLIFLLIHQEILSRKLDVSLKRLVMLSSIAL